MPEQLATMLVIAMLSLTYAAPGIPAGQHTCSGQLLPLAFLLGRRKYAKFLPRRERHDLRTRANVLP